MKQLSISLFSVLFSILMLLSCSNENGEKDLSAKNLDVKKKKPSTTLFSFIPSTISNIDFSNDLTETKSMNIIKYHYFYNGGGVACGDINNDGLPDLYFTANQLSDRLYLNKGNLKFEDISNNLPAHNDVSWTTGVTMADVNGDGFMDIYVCKSGKLAPKFRKNLLLINQGNSTFKERGEEYGLDDSGYSTQAAFFDFDKDGDLDMYLVNHEIKFISDYNRQIRESERHPYVGDKLYRNDEGKFVEVGKAAGINSTSYGFGLGVAISDLNNDSWPDIYVTNDFVEDDFMYLNNGDGTFKESIQSATKHISNYGMGVDIADINNDGLSEILVVDMVAKDNFRQKTNMSGMNPQKFAQCINFGFHYQYMYNSLQLNRGNSKFSEMGQLAGISNTDWSWSCLLADFDCDGNKDIFITNGLRKDVRNNDYIKERALLAEKMSENIGIDSAAIVSEQLLNIPTQKVSNYIFQNSNDLTFEDKSNSWGLSKPSFSNGSIYADLDNDGDLDLVVNNIDEKAFLYENVKNQSPNFNYLKVSLKGRGKNPFGIGTKIKVVQNDKTQHQEIYQTRGYQSSVSPIGHFGLGKSKTVDKLEVTWPDSKVSIVKSPPINQTIEVDYASAKNIERVTKKVEVGLFDVSEKHGINFVHKENFYNDYQDQILLPHKYSQLGPALTVGDVNGDGLEDFIVGGAAGYKTELYIQKSSGKFLKTKSNIPVQHKIYEDIEAVLFDVDGDKDLDLFLGSGGYEFDANSSLLQDRIYLNDGNGAFTYTKNALPKYLVTPGCVKPFDFDNDGDLDLFVGGRFKAKQYPLSPRSYLFENIDGKFKDITSEKASSLQKVGMVSDADWLDIDNDGKIELVIVGEWMPITVFSFDNNKFLPIDAKHLGLHKSNGWWFSLNKIDFDHDGDLDLVAGNLGLNYKYSASENRPFKVIAEDFDNNKTVDVVLSYSQEGVYYPVRGRECSSQQLPFIKKKFPNYKTFASASVFDVLGVENMNKASVLNAFSFATTLFENVDGKFLAKPFGNQVQLSSINDILVDDINGDGIMDLMMAGNLFYSEVETPRNDAGYGNLLLGTKSGGFDEIKPQQSGYFGEDEMKNIRAIKIGNKFTAYLVARNLGDLKMYRFK